MAKKTVFLISDSLNRFYGGTQQGHHTWVRSQEASLEYSSYEAAESVIDNELDKGYYQIQKVFIAQ